MADKVSYSKEPKFGIKLQKVRTGMKYREEKDSMGTVQVPEDAYYGAQTQRAAHILQ